MAASFPCSIDYFGFSNSLSLIAFPKICINSSESLRLCAASYASINSALLKIFNKLLLVELLFTAIPNPHYVYFH